MIIEVLKEYISNMNDADIIALHYEYCDATSDYDNYIYTVCLILMK